MALFYRLDLSGMGHPERWLHHVNVLAPVGARPCHCCGWAVPLLVPLDTQRSKDERGRTATKIYVFKCKYK